MMLPREKKWKKNLLILVLPFMITNLYAVKKGQYSNDIDPSVPQPNNSNHRVQTAIGVKAEATGTRASAYGVDSNATGRSSVAVGDSAKVSGDRAIAVGENSVASGTESQATGSGAQATVANTVAIGTDAKATNNTSTALGYKAEASHKNSMALGTQAHATKEKSQAFGYHAEAQGTQSIAIGNKAQTNGVESVAIGSNANATAKDSVALGQGAKATHRNSVALGANSETTEDNTVSVGKAGAEKKITNVADGVNAKDAVNISQLNSAYNTSMSLTGSTVKVTDGNGDVSVDLAGLQTTQGTNNAAAISAETTRAQTAEQTNATNIATNTNDIATNTGNISTNTSNITSNTGHIQTNTTNIATNAQAIANDHDGDASNELNTGVALNGTSLEVTDAGGTKSADLSGLQTVQGTSNANNIQTLASSIANDFDGDATNELNTNVTLNGTNLEVTDAGGTKSADLSGLQTTQGTANTLAIDTNTRGIAVNAQGIRINSSRISANTQRIIRVEDKVKYIHINQSSTALGRGAVARPTRSVAIGKYAHVDEGAIGSVALGAHSTVKKGVQNAVALGQYSVASEANTISVGNTNLKRRITNVADGINPYDAVNMHQFNALGGRVDRLDSKVRGIGAMNSAMSALVPNQRVSSDTQLSVGLGQYDGETAAAIGVFHYIGDNILLNAGASHSKESGTAARVGVTWGF